MGMLLVEESVTGSKGGRPLPPGKPSTSAPSLTGEAVGVGAATKLVGFGVVTIVVASRSLVVELSGTTLVDFDTVTNVVAG